MMKAAAQKIRMSHHGLANGLMLGTVVWAALLGVTQILLR